MILDMSSEISEGKFWGTTVWKCDVLDGENKSRSCWRIELDSSFPLGMVSEDNKLAGEDNFVGE